MIPGCTCPNGPPTVTQSYTGPCVPSDFHPCTITWKAVPSVFSGLGLGANAYLSNGPFTDPFSGGTFEYNLSCDTIYYRLARVYYPVPGVGPAYRDSAIYTWQIGVAGNTCTSSSLSLTNGTIYPGGDNRCIVSEVG
jgi:hypothetical protein